MAEQYRADDWEVIGSQSEKIRRGTLPNRRSNHWIETFKKPVITPDGMTLGTVGFARDITVRKEMERQLAESEERWELAIAGTNDGIWDWNLETNAVYFSDRWKDMLGYAPDEIDNDYKEWESRIHPDDIQRVLNAIIATWRMAAMYIRKSFGFDARQVTIDGSSLAVKPSEISRASRHDFLVAFRHT